MYGYHNKLNVGYPGLNIFSSQVKRRRPVSSQKYYKQCMEASKKILFYILGIKRLRLRTTEIGIFEDIFPEAFNERTDTILKPGGGGTPYIGLYGEAPPEMGTFFRLQVYKRVGISQV